PWEITYDGFGRALETRDALGNRSTAEYDDNGNPTVRQSYGSTGGLLAESTAVYDLLNRRTRSSEWLWDHDPASPPTERPADARELATRFTYDPASNVKLIEDPLDRRTTRRFDAAERLTEIEDAAGNRVRFTLDDTGNPYEQRTLELDPAGGVTIVLQTATFDALGRVATRSDAFENTWEFSYDPRHQPTLITDPEGYVTSYTYDGLNRRTQDL
ncbi:MAG: RHS repeat protein, partial [bacterium]|nr:RHS repeat protein [bacterium]